MGRTSKYAVLFVCFIGPVIASSHVYGQYPQRPPISTYLENYVIRPNSQIVDRYNAYQRPALQSQQVIAKQNSQINQQSQQLAKLQGDLQQYSTLKKSQTGVAGSFMNYSHYFPQQQSGTARRFR